MRKVILVATLLLASTVSAPASAISIWDDIIIIFIEGTGGCPGGICDDPPEDPDKNELASNKGFPMAAVPFSISCVPKPSCSEKDWPGY